MGPFELLKLPLRAPMISVLFVVAVVMGHQWSMAQMQLLHSPTISLELLIAAELFQLLAVLVICTMPELLMQRISMVMILKDHFGKVINKTCSDDNNQLK